MKKGCFQIEALQTQYDVAILELRKYLVVLITSDHERTLAEDVELLCSIVLLISIEVSQLSIPISQKLSLHQSRDSLVTPKHGKYISQQPSQYFLISTNEYAT